MMSGEQDAALADSSRAIGAHVQLQPVFAFFSGVTAQLKR